jgi:hypothetical protein
MMLICTRNLIIADLSKFGQMMTVRKSFTCNELSDVS